MNLWLFKVALSIRLMFLWLEEPPLLIYASLSKSRRNCVVIVIELLWLALIINQLEHAFLALMLSFQLADDNSLVQQAFLGYYLRVKLLLANPGENSKNGRINCHLMESLLQN